jgi:Na+-transporting NADH:ubiquinone oxidoreductase subunit A
MPDVIKIRKGLDIKLEGKAVKRIVVAQAADFALKPPDFQGLLPRLLVQEGDAVMAGSPVYCDKNNEKILFTSPVSGNIMQIVRGEKRRILAVTIKSDGKDESLDFGPADPNKLAPEEIIGRLLKSGAWPHIRQRPYTVVADPAVTPKAIFISAFDTSPLAPDYDFIIGGQGDVFQAGLDALARLTPGKVHLGVDAIRTTSRDILDAKGVRINCFSGPHPAGNVGVHIHHVDPINKGEAVWVVNPQSVLTIGRLFLYGRYVPEKIVALCGSEAVNPQYYKVKAGTSIQPLVKGNVGPGTLRYISGNVLTGTRIESDGYLGFYHDQITVIPEGNRHEFLGWAKPGLYKLSFSRTFLSALTPRRIHKPDTNLHGGHRAFVMTGQYEQVLPMDIYPMQLLKAILVDDIDMMENLGIYEVDEEDFALVEFIDPSKTEIQAIIRKGLDTMRKEMS